MTLLEQMRLDAHLSRAHLAAETGVSERTIRELESGRVRRPQLDTLVPLATRFHMSVSDLAANFALVHDELARAA